MSDSSIFVRYEISSCRLLNRRANEWEKPQDGGKVGQSSRASRDSSNCISVPEYLCAVLWVPSDCTLVAGNKQFGVPHPRMWYLLVMAKRDER
jgi:hypothetical protein